MTQTLVRETAMEFFKEQLEKAMEHQRISTSAFTEYYLVSLLTGSLRAQETPADDPGCSDLPLAVLYARAMAADGIERARLLRALGDTALFVSGFFVDSLPGRNVDLSYYQALGGRAYGRLGQRDELLGFGPEVFSELSQRFRAFADVLAEVADATRVGAADSILRLYERWLKTGSRLAAQRLVEQGVAPMKPEGLKLQ
jgi:hypothetical protein